MSGDPDCAYDLPDWRAVYLHPSGSEFETAALNFTSSTQTAALTVPLNGAYGAIQLFSAIDINPSLISGTTWTQSPPSAGYSVQEQYRKSDMSLRLEQRRFCPLHCQNGLSNVFQDNTLQVANTINGATTTTTNVCYGGDPNFLGFTELSLQETTNCFQPSYENAVTSFLGQDPDLATGLSRNLRRPTGSALQELEFPYPAVPSAGHAGG